jgi:2,4-dienoyl-CoA reductase-like NADH-dependent reductase (Old Yellow Enzyme family)
MRLPLELIQLSRTLLSPTKPLFLRLSATDWHPKGEKDPNGNYISWGEEQSSIFLNQAIALGVDLADISSAGLDSNQQIPIGLGYQVGIEAFMLCPLCHLLIWPGTFGKESEKELWGITNPFIEVSLLDIVS